MFQGIRKIRKGWEGSWESVLRKFLYKTSASPSAGWTMFLEERQGLWSSSISPPSGSEKLFLLCQIPLSPLSSQSILPLLGPRPSSALPFIWVRICSASSSLESRLLKERPGLLLLSTAVSGLSPGPVLPGCPTNRDWISTGAESEGSAWEGTGSSYLIPLISSSVLCVISVLCPLQDHEIKLSAL